MRQVTIFRFSASTFVVIEFVLMLSNAISNTAGLGGAARARIMYLSAHTNLNSRLGSASCHMRACPMAHDAYNAFTCRRIACP
jgi:hypothetical protein